MEKKIKKVEIDINQLSFITDNELNKLQDIFEKLEHFSWRLFGDSLSDEKDDILGAILAEQLKRETQKRDTWDLAVKG